MEKGLGDISEKLRKEAEEESKEILNDAKKRVNEILQQARKDAEKKREEILKAARNKCKVEKQRILASKRVEIKRETMELKNSLLLQLFDDVKRSLLKKDKNYAKFLNKRIRDAISSMDEKSDLLLILPKGDKKLLKKLKNVTIKESNELEWGFILTTKDRKVSIKEDINRKIEEIKYHRLNEIAKILFEE